MSDGSAPPARNASRLAMLLCALLGLAPPLSPTPRLPPPPGKHWCRAPFRAARRELDRAQAQLQQSVLPFEAGAAPQILREADRLVWRVPARLLFDPESTIPRDGRGGARTADGGAAAAAQAHADWRRRSRCLRTGSAGRDANLRFSQRRAEALLAWLTEEGVSPTRLRARPRAATAPWRATMRPRDVCEPPGRIRVRAGTAA